MISESELYLESQTILTCAVCACRYPSTRRRLAGEITPLKVCSDRCHGVLTARISAAHDMELATR